MPSLSLINVWAINFWFQQFWFEFEAIMVDDQVAARIAVLHVDGETTLDKSAEEIQIPKRRRIVYSDKVPVLVTLPQEVFERCMKFSTVREFVDISKSCQVLWRWLCIVEWPDFYIWHEDGYLIDDKRIYNLPDHPFVSIDQKSVLKAACQVHKGPKKLMRRLSQNMQRALMIIENATRKKEFLTKQQITLTDSKGDDSNGDIDVYACRLGWTLQDFGDRDGEQARTSPDADRIVWLNSVNATWQCGTPANQWHTTVITFVPSEHVRFIRQLSKTKLYCQGESGPRRLVAIDKKAFSWRNALVFNWPPQE